jgi:hypothetical protein
MHTAFRKSVWTITRPRVWFYSSIPVGSAGIWKVRQSNGGHRENTHETFFDCAHIEHTGQQMNLEPDVRVFKSTNLLHDTLFY